MVLDVGNLPAVHADSKPEPKGKPTYAWNDVYVEYTSVDQCEEDVLRPEVLGADTGSLACPMSSRDTLDTIVNLDDEGWPHQNDMSSVSVHLLYVFNCSISV